MANPEHLEILKQGVKVWNAWRAEYNRTKPELSQAELRQYDLTKFNLDRADLTGANLESCMLSEASFFRATLSQANLSSAYLRKAILRKTSFCDADLIAADLTQTDLKEADLSRTNLAATILNKSQLDGANFHNAKCVDTSFADVDLSGSHQLESVAHLGPSTIGIDTLYRSQGKIPGIFLRGCGVPENLITYLPSLLNQSIQFYSCFISYSHADKAFARRVHDTLQGQGIRCWLDEHQMNPGDDIYEEVDRGIHLWDKCCCAARKTHSQAGG